MEGWSYTDISSQLSISKSTLSGWLKSVAYHPNVTVIERIKNGPAKSIQVRNVRRLAQNKETELLSYKEVDTLTARDLTMLGIGIYLGEGAKTQEQVRITNSDPRVIRITITWLKSVIGLKNKNFAARIHAYPDTDIPISTKFWKEVTGFNDSQFYSAHIDTRKNKSPTNMNKSPHGTLHLTVKACGNPRFGVLLHRRIMGYINAVEQCLRV